MVDNSLTSTVMLHDSTLMAGDKSVLNQYQSMLHENPLDSFNYNLSSMGSTVENSYL